MVTSYYRSGSGGLGDHDPWKRVSLEMGLLSKTSCLVEKGKLSSSLQCLLLWTISRADALAIQNILCEYEKSHMYMF